jgi:hypothetical protein
MKMNRTILSITAIVIVVLSAFTMFNQSCFAQSTEPSQLKISIGPSTVLADNSAYTCIFVQLQDSSGKPARASTYTSISLSSSLTSVGTVESPIAIRYGETFAAAKFYSTFTPGTTVISAAATDYGTVQASITTVGSVPTALAVYGFPSTLPADGGSYDAIMVQLQDSSGSPAKAPKEGIQVTLSCSENSVGSVSSPLTIPSGQTYAIATFTTTNTKGQAIITAVTQDYTSKQATIITQNVATIPTQVKVFGGPTNIIADKSSYKQIAIELQDSSGNIVQAPSDLQVTLASSDESIGIIDSQITIPQSKTFVLATLNTTYKGGSTTITAAATNLRSNQVTMSTIGFIPTKLAIYCVPATLPSDNNSYQVIQVQLQDSQGRPAKDPEQAVNVNLFSSEPTVGSVNSMIVIPFGKTQATGALAVTNAPGSTTITAQASGYTTSQTAVTTYLIDFSRLKTTLTIDPTNIMNGNQSEVTAYVTVNGNPITGVTVTFSSNNGGTFSATTTQANGYYTATFAAPSFSVNTNCTITASASKTEYLSSQASSQITVGPTVTGNQSGTIQFYVIDEDGNPLSNTIISSKVQPNGGNNLFDLTNSSGYITFKNLTMGLYSFRVIKDGYTEMNETIEYTTSQPLMLTITLTNSAIDNTTLIIIVSIVIAATVISVISGLFIVKRKKSAKIRKLQDLQKQLKYKY